MATADLAYRVTTRRAIAPEQRIPLVERLNRPGPLVAWIGAHIVLAELAALSTAVSRAHFVIASTLCVLAALRATSLAQGLVPIFYALPLDVFWRMTGTISPWEGGKYLTTILGLIVLVRFVGRPRRAALPLLYLALLLPGIYPTLYARGFGEGRGQLAFYLAGPIAFVVLAIVFGEITIRWTQLEKLLWIMLGPMAAITFAATRTTSALQVSDFESLTSNADSSGGYGPNQVSAILSLGALLCLFIVLRDRRIHFRLIAGAIALWMAGQSALTFSRGGVVNLLAAAVIVVPALLIHRSIGPRVLATLIIGVMIVGLVVIPSLEAFTGDSLGQRFADRELTGREQLTQKDLQLFQQTLPWGVGISQADAFHELGDARNVASHNEFSRLLAEHGLLGLIGVFLLLAMAATAFVRQPGNLGRAWAGGLAMWGMAEMTHSSTRLAVGMGVIALAMLRVIDDGIDDAEELEGPQARPATIS